MLNVDPTAEGIVKYAADLCPLVMAVAVVYALCNGVPFTTPPATQAIAPAPDGLVHDVPLWVAVYGKPRPTGS